MIYKISNYKFGEMEIDDEVYTEDLILMNDMVYQNWRRERGHNLVVKDLETVLKHKPDLIVLGTGAHGQMKVPEETIRELKEEHDVDLEYYPSTEAVEKYNDYIEENTEYLEEESKTDKLIVGAFHLTC